jgi:hypothetical protein
MRGCPVKLRLGGAFLQEGTILLILRVEHALERCDGDRAYPPIRRNQRNPKGIPQVLR